MSDEYGCIYRPPQGVECKAHNATLGVRFAENTFISKSCFKTFGIGHVPDDELDMSFMGLGLYKKDKDGIITEKWKKYVGSL